MNLYFVRLGVASIASKNCADREHLRHMARAMHASLHSVK